MRNVVTLVKCILKMGAMSLLAVMAAVLVASGQMKTSTPHVTLPDGEWTVGLCRYRVDIMQILCRYCVDTMY